MLEAIFFTGEQPGTTMKGAHIPLLALALYAVATVGAFISLIRGVTNRLVLLVAVATLFSLPLVAIVYQATSSLNEDIRFTAREQQGLAYHEELIDLLLSLQNLRGKVNISQHSENGHEVGVEQQQEEVRRWIASVDAVDQRYGVHLGVQQDWLALKPRFAHFLDDHSLHGHEEADTQFTEHTKIIRELMLFMEKVVDRSNLNTDPEPDSNLVADVLYNLMPETTESLGQMRSIAAGYLASHHHQPQSWTSREDKKLRALYDQLGMLDTLMTNRLARSARIVPRSQRFVDYHADSITPKLRNFATRYEQMIFLHKTGWSSQALFSESSDIIKMYDVLYDDMIDGFSDVLKHRQEKYALKKGVVLLSSTVGLLGLIALFVFLFRGLTKTEIAEREARQARKAAEHAAAAKSDFLANMSHELRTPMNGVLGMAQLLADTELSDEQRQYISTINDSGENLLMLLNDILDFSKIEAGALVLEHIAYDIGHTLNIAANLLQTQADKKGLEFRVNCEAGLPQYIWGDPGRVRQIIINLLGNAIKFTAHGHVRLDARLQEYKGKNQLYISVEDTGIGIAADKLGNIFDKFTQADASVTRKFGGSGLGLAITRQLVELMGGRIGVESAEGKGSTFWFSLPFEGAHASDIIATKENVQQHTKQNGVARLPVSQARALLVEDYPVNQVFAEKLLKKFGFQHIDLAVDGSEALLKFNENHYDIIFMDCQMPRLDGYINTQEIRMLEAVGTSHVPIIAMTANAMMGDREKCLAAGMDDYLSKPLRAGHLKKILEAWFQLDAQKAVITRPASAAAEPAEAPVDMEQLRVFTDGDPQEEKELFDLFIDQAHAMIDVLRQNTGEGGEAAWKSAAHRFKGSSGNLGAMKLHHLCMRAETHFADARQKKLEMLAAIKAETARVQEFFASSAA